MTICFVAFLLLWKPDPARLLLKKYGLLLFPPSLCRLIGPDTWFKNLFLLLWLPHALFPLCLPPLPVSFPPDCSAHRSLHFTLLEAMTHSRIVPLHHRLHWGDQEVTISKWGGGVRMGYPPAFRQPRSVTFMIILLFQYSHDVSGRSGPGLRRFRPKENSGRSAGVLCH